MSSRSSHSSAFISSRLPARKPTSTPPPLACRTFHRRRRSATAMSAASGAGMTTAQKIGRMTRWYIANRDCPEVFLLFGAVGGALGLAAYTVQRTLLNNDAGAYVNVNIRGSPEKQVETARVGLSDPATGSHSLFWHVAQLKTDDDGANIGVVFDNRTRAHQYSKPGFAGIAAGQNTGAI